MCIHTILCILHSHVCMCTCKCMFMQLYVDCIFTYVCVQVKVYPLINVSRTITQLINMYIWLNLYIYIYISIYIYINRLILNICQRVHLHMLKCIQYIHICVYTIICTDVYVTFVQEKNGQTGIFYLETAWHSKALMVGSTHCN